MGSNIQTEEFIKNLFEGSKNGLIVAEEKTKTIVTLTEIVYSLFDVEKKEELEDLIFKNVLNSDILENISENIFFDFEFCLNKKKWLNISIKKLPLDNKEYLLILTSNVDLYKKLQSEINKSRYFINKIAEASPDSIYIYNFNENRVTYSNYKLLQLLGYNKEYIKTTKINYPRDLVHKDDLERYDQRKEDYSKAQDHEVIEGEYRMIGVRGDIHWVHLRGSIFSRNEDGSPKEVAGFSQDVTLRKELEQKLIHDAMHDDLTHLPNRNLFHDHLRNAIDRKRRKKKYLFAVLFLDLDRFKLINDSLGHLVGDDLLVEVSRKLVDLVRPSDTVARIGGDEFAILLEDVRDLTDATNVSKRILEEVSKPFKINENEIFTSISIGIALATTITDTPDDLIRNADIAMYHAKIAGKARYQVFNSVMRTNTVFSQQIESELYSALEKEELKVFFQPVINLFTKQIIGLEAFVRWEHPTKGLLLPSDFIDTANEIGIINKIDFFVINEICSKLKIINLFVDKNFYVSSNISSKHFYQHNFIDEINKIINGTAFNPKHLRFEINEKLILDNNEHINLIFQKIKELGIQIQIDDFGTGYSSLSYLHRLPISALKIDHSFINRIKFDIESVEIIKTIISLSKSLGISVIAEGVEELEQIEILKSLNCPYGQGFIFHKPLSLDDTLKLLENQERLSEKNLKKTLKISKN